MSLLHRLSPSALCLIALFLPAPRALAVSLQTTGIGSAVTAASLSANFDSINSFEPLNAYIEGGLNVTIPQVAFEEFDPFNGGGNGSHFFYGAAYSEWVTISAVSSALIYGAEFLYGTGWSSDSATFHWRTLDASSAVISSGTVLNLTRGTVIGIADAGGFSTLQIVSESDPFPVPPSFNAIAIDDLRVQTSAPTAVSDSATTALLLGAALISSMMIRGRETDARAGSPGFAV